MTVGKWRYRIKERHIGSRVYYYSQVCHKLLPWFCFVDISNDKEESKEHCMMNIRIHIERAARKKFKKIIKGNDLKTAMAFNELEGK